MHIATFGTNLCAVNRRRGRRSRKRKEEEAEEEEESTEEAAEEMGNSKKLFRVAHFQIALQPTKNVLPNIF